MRSGCTRKLSKVDDSYEREVRDLPCFEFRTMVVIELYRAARIADEGGEACRACEQGSFQRRFEKAEVRLRGLRGVRRDSAVGAVAGHGAGDRSSLSKTLAGQPRKIIFATGHR